VGHNAHALIQDFFKGEGVRRYKKYPTFFPFHKSKSKNNKAKNQPNSQNPMGGGNKAYVQRLNSQGLQGILPIMNRK
jgi:hypothetical protein